jgi:hypothetical protein
MTEYYLQPEAQCCHRQDLLLCYFIPGFGLVLAQKADFV